MKITVQWETVLERFAARNLVEVLQVAAPMLINARVAGPGVLEMVYDARWSVPQFTIELAEPEPPPPTATAPVTHQPRELIFDDEP